MLFKEAARLGASRRIAGLSLLALAGAGLFFAVTAKSRVRPAASQPVAAPAPSAPARMRPVVPAEQSRIASSFGHLPLSFEPNQGQTDAPVKFLSRNSRYNLFLTPSEAVFTLPLRSKQSAAARTPFGAARAKHSRLQSEAVLRMEILRGNPAAQLTGATQIEGHSNYFIGRDASKWVRDVPHYERVNYNSVYPGVDLAFYGQQDQLEFDFVVKPGASPDAIALGIEGAHRIRTENSGDLVLCSAAGDVRLLKPVAYQQQGQTRQPVDARFVVKGSEVALALGQYDRSRELVIDPSVLYATYLGAGSEDDGYAITVDSAGAAYVTGQTSSASFPGGSHGSGISNTLAGPTDAFVVKMNANGTSPLVYSTFLGGTGDDSGNAIAIDSSQQAYVAGTTSSTDFPPGTTPAAQGTPGGGKDAFVAVLNAAGNGLVYSTYLGGVQDELAEGIAVDANGIYVAGQTSSSAFQGSVPVGSVLPTTFLGGTGTLPTDGFVAKLRPLPLGTLFAWVFLGGTGNDVATGVAVDTSSNVYVTGATFSTNLHTTAGAYQLSCGTDGNCNGGQEDSFVGEIKSDFSNYQYLTYLGGSGGDDASMIVVDASQNAYVVGVTNSTDFPTNGSNAGYKTTLASGATGNAYVTVLKPGGGSLLYSTYLGGGSLDTALAVALDTATPPRVYVTGQTSSTNFPTVNPTQSKNAGGNDAFVSELNPNVSGTSSLVFSTYLGGSADEDHFLAGIAVDSNGNIYVTGDTQSVKDFPVTPGAFKTTATNSGGTACNGVCRDAFVVKYSPQGPPFSLTVGAVTPSAISRPSSGTSTVTVTSTGPAGTVQLGCSVTAAAIPPTCSLSPTSGSLAASGTLTSTLTISTIKTASTPITGAAMWLPVPGLALLGAGFLPDKSGKRKLLRRLLAALALTGLLLMAGCGNGTGGGGGGGGGGGTTTGSYTVTVTGAVVGVGSGTGNATFSVQ